MDINILIICITVVICVAFAAGSVAYVADRSHKRWEGAIALLSSFCVAAFEGAVEELSDDE